MPMEINMSKSGVLIQSTCLTIDIFLPGISPRHAFSKAVARETATGVVNSSARRTCFVTASKQHQHCTSMSSPPAKSATSPSVKSTLGMAEKEVEIVRYHPSQLKIEKRPGKQTASSFFCPVARRPAAASAARTRADGESSSSEAAAMAPRDAIQ